MMIIGCWPGLCVIPSSGDDLMSCIVFQDHDNEMIMMMHHTRIFVRARCPTSVQPCGGPACFSYLAVPFMPVKDGTLRRRLAMSPCLEGFCTVSIIMMMISQ